MYAFIAILLLCFPMLMFAASTEDPAAEIMKLERAAMERWGKGDVEGFLEIYADDIVYFDPFIPKRMDGLAEVTKLYRSFAGQVHFDRFEFIDPKIELSGDLAVCTFNFVSYTAGKENRWNTTEVYRKIGGKWKVVHSHWSLTQPKLAEKPADS